MPNTFPDNGGRFRSHLLFRLISGYGPWGSVESSRVIFLPVDVRLAPTDGSLWRPARDTVPYLCFYFILLDYYIPISWILSSYRSAVIGKREVFMYVSFSAPF